MSFIENEFENNQEGIGDEVGKKFQIVRPMYNIEEFNYELDYIPWQQRTLKEKMKKKYRNFTCKKFIKQLFPFLSWLPGYDIKQDLLSDIITGFTVGIMQIPQGLGYAMLAKVPPVIGIYMAFYPTFVYFILGTSRQISIGVFAVACVMTSSAVDDLLEKYDGPEKNGSESELLALRIQMTMAVTFCVGILLLIMYILQLGFITNFLSQTLVNGFTSGAAFHVLLMQMIELFGFEVPEQQGLFNFVYMFRDLCLEVKTINKVTSACGIIAVICILFNNYVIKPRLAKKTRCPFPIELMLVVVGVIISYYLHFEKYQVRLVGFIPKGLPPPILPRWEFVPRAFLHGLPIAMVTYIITVSMGMIFATQGGYELNANQELLALSVADLIGSCFMCLPLCASLSRSLVQQSMGGKTQITSIVSSLLLLIVLLWLAPLCQYLPRCFLAAIIVVALKTLILQVLLVRQFWRLNKIDFVVWACTFLTVVFVDIDIGLLVGLIISFASVIRYSLLPYNCILGQIPGTTVFGDIKLYKRAQEIPNIKIFSYTGGLSFGQCEIFLKRVVNSIQVDPVKVLAERKKFLKRQPKVRSVDSIFRLYNDPKFFMPFKCLILDISGLSYLDPSGVYQMRVLVSKCEAVDVLVLIVGPNCYIYEIIKKCDEYHNNPLLLYIFPYLQDAVTFAKDNIL